DRWKLATKKVASEIEAEVSRDISNWSLLKANWIRIDKRNDREHVTTAEEWTDENNSTFQETAERLGVSEYTPKSYPKRGAFSHDRMNQGESLLRRKPLPTTERTARIEAIRLREKRQAVHPWIVVMGSQELGRFDADVRVLDLIGNDPVIEVTWGRRSAAENVPDAKPLPQKFLIRLIGMKPPGAVGSTCHVSQDLLVGQSRAQTIQGKKVQVLDAMPINIRDALIEINEQLKADELDLPLPEPARVNG
ncbi:MAG: hypothetical protein ACKPEA_16800, partial [Planctomycetota bacterium]